MNRQMGMANGKKHFMSVDYTSISTINMHRFGWVINNNYNVCLFSWNEVHFSNNNNNNKITIDCIWMLRFLKSFPLSLRSLDLSIPRSLGIVNSNKVVFIRTIFIKPLRLYFYFIFSYSFCSLLLEIVWEI